MNLISQTPTYKALFDAFARANAGTGYVTKGCAATANGAGSLQVNVAAGEYVSGGIPRVYAGGNITPTPADPNPANSRRDIVYFSATGVLSTTAGVAAVVNPVPPAWPAMSCPIAILAIPGTAIDYSAGGVAAYVEDMGLGRADPVGAINVKTAGALGDGVTDDTAVFQAALDAIDTAGGGTLWVPRGTFELGRINMGSNTTIRGTGRGSVLHEISDANEIISTKAGANDLVIRDLHFLGRGITPLGVGYAIIDRNSAHSRILVEGCTFTNFSAGGIHIGLAAAAPGGLCSDYIIRNCHFFENGLTTGNVTGVAITNADRVLIEGCTVTKTGAAQSYVSSNAAIDVEPNVAGDLCTNIVIKGCFFRNVGSSSINVTNTVGATVRWVTISDCTMADNYLDGLHVATASDTTITGCLIHNNGRSGLFIGGDRTVITGCEIVDNNASLGNQGQVYIESCVDTVVVGNRIGMTTATGTAPAVVEAGTANRSYIANNNCTSAIAVTMTIIGTGSVTIGNTGYTSTTGRQMVKRVKVNAALTVVTAGAAGYVDFGAGFNTTLTTLAGDEICIRIQSVGRKLTSGFGAVVVDVDAGTKLPGPADSSVVFDISAEVKPFAYEYWYAPGAGAHALKPQIYSNDVGIAGAGFAHFCQVLYEVWR